MDAPRRYALGNAALAAVALVHALATWPLPDAVALFAGGAVVASVAEAVGVRAGLLRHHATPKVAGVPLAVVVAWPAIVYVAIRAVAPVVPAGVPTAVAAALLAAAADAVAEPRAVEAGLWTYPDHPLSTPRYRGVPWWNAPSWLTIAFVTATLPSVL